MGRIHDEIVATAFPDGVDGSDRFDIIDGVLAVVVNEIEAKKNSEVREYHLIHDLYLRGEWRKYGYSKQDALDKIIRHKARVEAYESALSVCYLAMSDNKSNVDPR